MITSGGVIYSQKQCIQSTPQLGCTIITSCIITVIDQFNMKYVSGPDVNGEWWSLLHYLYLFIS